MRTLFLMTALGLALAPAKEIATEYKAGVARKITIESAVHMETTSMEIERDGEKQDGFGGSSTDTERTEIHIDQVLEAEDGKPTKVRRQFVDVGGNSAMEFGETSRESELESPWKGVTIELTPAGEGKSEAEVVAGTEPSGDGALDGHAIGLFLDGFLPSKAVEEGGEWDIASAAIVRGLRLDVQRKLFPPPERGEGREGGGGGGGRRGGRGGGGGGDSFLAQAEWKGTGTFAGTEEKGGVSCAVIELELETSGDAEIERGGGGPGGRALTSALENRRTWSAKLTGKLWFDTAAKRPVQLELEGSMQEETNTESDRGGSTMRIHAVREGKIEYSVEIEDAPAEEVKK
jgi:hypothetical protein